MRTLLTIILIMYSSNVAAKIETWECYFQNGNVFDVFKLDTDIPSVHVYERGKWKEVSQNIAFDKKNQNLYDELVGDEVWDLLLKKYNWILGNSYKVYDCKVIGPQKIQALKPTTK